jgi:Domain of unknown function (DUF4159)
VRSLRAGALQYRDQARRVYHVAVFEAKMEMRNKWLGAVLLLIAIGIFGPLFAQRQNYERQNLMEDLASNRRPPPGSEFIFPRILYTTIRAARGFGGFRGGEGWSHDYPVAEQNILAIAEKVTRIKLNDMSYVILRLDSSELFEYPFIYFSEVGEMQMSDREVANFRDYLNRGGFAVVDDFDNKELLDWFQGQMRRVFPDRTFVKLAVDHPIFHPVYDMETLNLEGPEKPRRRAGEHATFYGYYDDRGRLCMIINHNNDIGDFWEWIDQPRYPLPPSIDGIHLGINYMVYSMTH